MANNLTVVSGCNASGKSSFIRSRMTELDDYEIIMPDVYKSNTENIPSDTMLNK